MELPLTRREALVAGGVAGAGLAAAGYGLLRPGPVQAQTANCVLTAARTEGPYFVDEKLNRSDLRTDPSDGTTQTGIPLTLTLTVINANTCAPIGGAQVDMWHCNADGLYSDESANGTVGKKYLRGHQVTDANGRVTFVTVYPGWYSGRAIHIHYKVRIFDGTATALEFTGQLFFDEAVNSQVNASGRYDDRGTRNVVNSADNIYGNDGPDATVRLTGNVNSGFSGSYVVGLSGAPSGGGSGAVVAKLGATRWKRTKAGTRLLQMTVDTYEPVVVIARLIRNGKVLVRKQTSTLAIGSRVVNLAVPKAVKDGSARLKITIKDQSGTSRTTNKTVRIPKRAA